MPALRDKLRDLRLDTLWELLGCFLASSEELRAFAAGAPVNTDDRPVVTFRAPRFAYAGPQPPAGRLLSLLDSFHPAPEAAMGAPRSDEDRATGRRLAAYWEARNEFLRSGAGVQETDDARQLFAAAGGHLLTAVRMSPDFSAAYNPLLAIAERLRNVDPAAAIGLLRDLEAANPFRPEARVLRERLFAH
jgi:spermidine synthase